MGKKQILIDGQMVDTANTMCIHTIEQMQNFTIFLLQVGVQNFVFTLRFTWIAMKICVCMDCIYVNRNVKCVYICMKAKKNSECGPILIHEKWSGPVQHVSDRVVGSHWNRMQCFHFWIKINKNKWNKNKEMKDELVFRSNFMTHLLFYLFI